MCLAGSGIKLIGVLVKNGVERSWKYKDVTNVSPLHFGGNGQLYREDFAVKVGLLLFILSGFRI